MEIRKVEGFCWHAGQDSHWIDVVFLPYWHTCDAIEVQPSPPHQHRTQRCSGLPCSKGKIA